MANDDDGYGFPQSAEQVRERLGSEVRRLRMERRWTQPDLARELAGIGVEMHQTTMAKLEAGARPTPAEELWALAVVLETDVNSLLPPTEPAETSVDQARIELERWKREVKRLQQAYARQEDMLRGLGATLSTAEARLDQAGRDYMMSYGRNAE